jgi:hypothetical protein
MIFSNKFGFILETVFSNSTNIISGYHISANRFLKRDTSANLRAAFMFSQLNIDPGDISAKAR